MVTLWVTRSLQEAEAEARRYRDCRVTVTTRPASPHYPRAGLLLLVQADRVPQVLPQELPREGPR